MANFNRLQYKDNFIRFKGNILSKKVLKKVTKSGYGALYNWQVTQESDLINGFIVPTDSQWGDMAILLDGVLQAGGKLKSTRTDPDIHPRWNSPNTGAMNEVNFAAFGGGQREDSGFFDQLGIQGFFWADEFSAEFANTRSIAFNGAQLNSSTGPKNLGISIRLTRTLTSAEESLDDGTFLQPVQDYDGNWYEVVKIGTLGWAAQNLRTEHFTNGTPIPILSNDSDWENATGAAMCYFNNDPELDGIVFTDEFITV